MANDFSSFANCKALWRFEPGALATDSISTNTLTTLNNFVQSATDSGYVREGTGSVYFHRDSSYYSWARIADSSLAAGFPFKSGDATKLITITCWVKPLRPVGDTGSNEYIWAKNTSSYYSIGLSIYNNYFQVHTGYSSGASQVTSYVSGTYAYHNTWHFISVAIDGINKKIDMRIWCEATQKWVRNWFTVANEVSATTAAFTIGADSSASGTYDISGWIDEVAVFNCLLTDDTIDQIKRGIFSGASMPNNSNNFSSTSDCKALYCLESGALTTDSKSTNTLTASASPPTSDTGWINYKEGSGSALYTRASSQYHYINDSSLASGFPLKSGDSTKIFTTCFWMRYTSATSIGALVSKYNATSNKRCFSIHYTTTNQLRVYWGHTSGTAAETLACGNSSIGTNVWYHVSVCIDGVNKKCNVYIYSDYSNTVYLYEFSPTNELSTTDAPFCIGANDNVDYWNGWIDEVVVFDKFLSPTDIDKVRNRMFSGSLTAPLIFRSILAQMAYRSVDNRPYSCVNSSTGQNWYSGNNFNYPLRTLAPLPHSPGAKYFVAKSSESALSGTASITNGSKTVTTTVDFASPRTLRKYDLIRFDSESIPYYVDSVTTNTITLYRPYQGTTGSGKVMYNVVDFPVCFGEITNNNIHGAFNADPDLDTHLIGGFDPAGLTVTTNAYTNFGLGPYTGSGFTSTASFLQLSGFAHGHPTGPQLGGKFVTVFDCLFRPSQISGYYWRNVTVNDSVFEAGSLSFIDYSLNCTLNNVDIFGTSATVLGSGYSHINLTLNDVRFLEASSSSYIGNLGTDPNSIINLNCIDCDFGGMVAPFNMSSSNSYKPAYIDATFRNCKHSFTKPINSTGGDNYSWIGQLRFEDYNQVSGDNRIWTNDGYNHLSTVTTNPLAILSRDAITVLTNPESLRVELVKGAIQTLEPFIYPYIVNMTAGVTTTISAYMRKNSSYGSAFLPKMVVKYSTGIPPTVTRNTTEIEMSDVADTWSQVSRTISTPDGAADLEFHFWSENSSAVAWVTDISIQEEV